MKIFTWHIHGSYLYYLSQGDYQIYIPVTASRTEEGYYGRGETFPFSSNVIEVPVEEIPGLEFDCILFQTNRNYLTDQYEILTESQRNLPAVYLEHDPPARHPTNTVHIMQDPRIMLVHVTHFNRLMWDNGNIDTTVIEHGVTESKVTWRGDLNRGVVVINNLPSRGRLLGFDLFLEAKKHLPIDLVGMGTGAHGQGEVLHPDLPAFISRYRFFYNPIRWTSLGLAICEAMMMGIPVVGLATTELSSVLENGRSGIIHTNHDYLISEMKDLLNNRDRAAEIGQSGKLVARERFNIRRFTAEWKQLFERCIRTSVVKQDQLKPVLDITV